MTQETSSSALASSKAAVLRFKKNVTAWPLWAKLAGALGLALGALILVAVLCPWDALRGTVNDVISERAGRRFEITRKLDVKLGGTTRIIADGVEFANPSWAQDRMLVSAQGAEIDINLWALLTGRVELVRVKLIRPRLGLQVGADGRKSWALGDGSGVAPRIDELLVDEGSAHYVSAAQGADIEIAFALESDGKSKLPLTFKAKGTWKQEPFSASGRSGDALRLGAPSPEPFPLEFTANAARSLVSAKGSVRSLSPVEGVDAKVELKGANLADLYKLVGIVFPATPPYTVASQVSSRGPIWTMDAISGKLGSSDLSGKLILDRSGKAPRLTGAVSSKALNFDDLAPLVGLPTKKTVALAQKDMPEVQNAQRAPPPGRVLPTAELDAEKLRAMDADVTYSATRVVNAHQLPLDSISLRARLSAGVLSLEDLRLGVAGGAVVGSLRVDGNKKPAAVEAKLDARSMDLKKLFPPTARVAQASFGKVHGEIDLKGSGNSVARMLASSSGNVALVMGKGTVGSLLVAFAELDGLGVVANLLRKGQVTDLRCAAASFDVKAGVMKSRKIVIDVEDAVFEGSGTVGLGSESLDLTAMAYPKGAGILSFRSPLKVSGTFASPSAGVDKATLTGKAGIFAALSLVNPILGLATTFQSGTGRDVDCPSLLRDARAPSAAARAAAAGAPTPGRPASAGAQRPGKVEKGKQ